MPEEDIIINNYICVFIDDIVVFKGRITKDNIGLIKKHINDGCKYYVKK